MIEKTNAILLHSIKYGESSLILQCYTERFGRISVHARGIRRKSRGKARLLPQPLQLLSITIGKKETRELSSLREMDFAYMTSQAGVEISKSVIAIFIADLLNHTLREEESDPRLFNFLKDSIINLDIIQSGVENFHLWFAVRLAGYLGLAPLTPEATGTGVLDFESGSFIVMEPGGEKLLNSFNSDLFIRFNNIKPDSLEEIKLSGSQRERFLSGILNYYSHHLPGSGNLKSLAVLTELFR